MLDMLARAHLPRWPKYDIVLVVRGGNRSRLGTHELLAVQPGPIRPLGWLACLPTLCFGFLFDFKRFFDLRAVPARPLGLVDRGDIDRSLPALPSGLLQLR